ncbi:hypothetical protein U1Q18_028189 [Sarracenia purpurea var. burkii]
MAIWFCNKAKRFRWGALMAQIWGFPAPKRRRRKNEEVGGARDRRSVRREIEGRLDAATARGDQRSTSNAKLCDRMP